MSLAARIEASAKADEILTTDKVKFHKDNRGYFEFLPRRVALKKGIGNKKSGDFLDCYSIKLLKSVENII